MWGKCGLFFHFRMAIDYSVPLITDVKCAKLLIESLSRVVEPK